MPIQSHILSPVMKLPLRTPLPWRIQTPPTASRAIPTPIKVPRILPDYVVQTTSPDYGARYRGRYQGDSEYMMHSI